MREVTRKSRLQNCKTCHKKSYKVSQHGNCQDCATEKVKLANLQMKHKEGPTYDKWKLKMLKTLGVEI